MVAVGQLTAKRAGAETRALSMLHAVPSQESIRPFSKGAPRKPPTALHSVAVGQLTPTGKGGLTTLSWLQSVPFQEPKFGIVLHSVVVGQLTAKPPPPESLFHVVPFQDTAPKSPTALQSVAVGQLTPCRFEVVEELSKVQLVPSQDQILPATPTALQSVVVGQLIAKKSEPTLSALQLVPFQEMMLPRSSTALHRVVVGQLTPLRRRSAQAARWSLAQYVPEVSTLPELSTLQFVPFQERIVPSPTALQNVVVGQLTALRRDP
jgi:hypothetical protein